MNMLNFLPMTISIPPKRSMTLKQPHVSVLEHEAIRFLQPEKGSLFIDATLGSGGHTQRLLENSNCRVIGIDRDPMALEIAKQRLNSYGNRITMVHGKFSQIEEHLERLGVLHVDGILADIGVSSMQIDDAERGMSFRFDGPLDMRMDTTEGETALDVIDQSSDDELADLIFRFGEERRSRRVARCIKQAREQGVLETTMDLRRAVIKAVGPARIGGVDPATKTFQALRISVNHELEELHSLLEASQRILPIGGVLAVISFHSLEDRIVKRTFQNQHAWQPLTKKPLTPSDEEIYENARSRSAKLRVARRISDDSQWPIYNDSLDVDFGNIS